MTKISWSVIGFAMVASLVWGSPARGQDSADEQLGIVHFATSCKEAAQQRFDRAMRYQHSFWYRASREGFEQVLQADPGCAMAYWGIALSLLLNPHVPAPKDNLALGLAVLQKGAASPAPTKRERDYIEALLVFYADHETVAHGARAQRYLQAMETVAQRYPGDDEAQIGYALALSAAASPNDKTYANQLKGAAILEPIFTRQPRHPGVAHYLIHLYDYPPIAARGLDAAKRYAEIAPGGPACPAHALAHLHARGSLEGIDRVQRGLGPRREGRQRAPRPAARDGLPGLRASAARPGQRGAVRRRRDGGKSRATTRTSGPDPTPSRPAKPGT